MFKEAFFAALRVWQHTPSQSSRSSEWVPDIFGIERRFVLARVQVQLRRRPAKQTVQLPRAA